MIGKWLLSALIVAAVLMAWGFIVWSLLASALGIVQPAPAAEDWLPSLRDDIEQSGVYIFPPFPTSDDAAETERWARAHRRGPIGMLIYHREGAEPMHWSVFAQGFVHFFVSALLVGLILLLALPALGAYLARVMIVFFAGLFAAVSVDLSPAIWWYQPWGFALYNALYTASSWLIAGLIMAAMIRPRGAGLR